MKVLVTGAAGFIGSHVVEALLARGDEVVVLDDFSTGTNANLVASGMGETSRTSRVAGYVFQEGYRFVQRPDDVAFCVRGADAVIHLAAQANISASLADPTRTFDVNVTGTLNVLRAAAEAGVRRVVIASSSSVYGVDGAAEGRHDLGPASPYAASKLCDEALVQTWSRMGALDACCLRFFNVYGPRQRPDSAYAAAVPAFFSALLAGKPPTIYGDGEQRRDFVYVKDVASALIAAVDAPADSIRGQVFDVGTGAEVSVNELARLCAEAMGLGDLEPVHAEARPADARSSVARVDEIQWALHWAPKMGLLEGLTETGAWYRRRAERLRAEEG